MEVFRICLTKYCTDISGKGAEIFGGRWNQKGIPMLYTSSNRSLSALETIVNINSFPKNASYSIITLEIPSQEIKTIHWHELPEDWSQNEYSATTLNIGSVWAYKNESLALKVPSCIMPEEHNVLINVRHLDFQKVKIVHAREFVFDNRIKLNEN